MAGDSFLPEVDEDRCELVGPAPVCPSCGAIARPSIMMFGDDVWHEQPAADQEARLRRWLRGVTRLVVIEVGAGTSIPSVRNFSHEMVIEHDARLIRINPREASVPRSLDVSIAAPALLPMLAIDRRMAVL